MISANTNVWVEFFRGRTHKSTAVLQQALEEKQLVMNPFVLAELLSSPKLPKKTEGYLLALPRMEVNRDFFERAGLLRRQIYSEGKGIPIADIYIAQACIDAKVSLLTLDRDLLMVSEFSELDLVKLIH